MKNQPQEKMEKLALSLSNKVSEFIDEQARTAELIFSTEDLVDRVIYYNGAWQEVYLQLSHDMGAVNLSRLNDGANLLWMHDAEQILGVVEQARIDGMDKKGKAKVRFSKGEFGEKIFREVLDGIITKVSVGFQMPDYDKESKLVGEKDGKPILRILQWYPVEMSLVSIPAIPGAKVGNSKDGVEALLPESKGALKGVESQKEDLGLKEEQTRSRITMENDPKIQELQAEIAELKTSGPKMMEGERKRVEEITAIAEEFKDRDGVIESMKGAIREGLSADAFGRSLLLKVQSKPTPSTKLGMAQKEIQAYSFMKVCQCLYEGKPLDGVEGEAHKELLTRTGRVMEKGKVLIPYDVQKRKMDLSYLPPEIQDMIREKMALQVGTTGAYLVEQMHSTDFIGLFYSLSLISQLGITTMPGLVGNVDFPRMATGSTGYWVGESNAPTASSPTLGRILLSPKTVAGRTAVSRKIIKQGTPAVEQILMKDLAMAIATAVNTALTQGSGSANQPSGLAKLLTDASISEITSTAFSYSKARSYITALKNANAYLPGVKWLTTPTVEAILAVIMKESSTWSPLFNDETGKMAGHDLVSSVDSKGGHLFMGLWSSMLFADWGVLELDMVEDTSNQDSGDKMLRAFFDCDMAVRQPTAFAWSSSVTAPS